MLNSPGSPSLYRQVMLDDLDALGEEVRRLHDLRGRYRLHGQCVIRGPANPCARLLAWIMRLPRRNGEAILMFELEADARRERWVRHFPNARMTSSMRVIGGELVEHLGPAHLHFHLRRCGTSLDMQLRRVSVLGLPWPRWLAPSIKAREHASAGRFNFDVAAAMPLLGHVVAYRGYLDFATLEELP